MFQNKMVARKLATKTAATFFLLGVGTQSKKNATSIFESSSWGAIAVTRLAFCFKSNVFPIISCNLLFERNTWWTVLLDSPIVRKEDIVDVQKAFEPLFMVYFGNDYMLNTLKLDDFGTTDVEDFLSMSWIKTIRTRDPVTDRKIKSTKVNYLLPIELFQRFSRMRSFFSTDFNIKNGSVWGARQSLRCCARTTTSSRMSMWRNFKAFFSEKIAACENSKSAVEDDFSSTTPVSKHLRMTANPKVCATARAQISYQAIVEVCIWVKARTWNIFVIEVNMRSKRPRMKANGSVYAAGRVKILLSSNVIDAHLSRNARTSNICVTDTQMCGMLTSCCIRRSVVLVRYRQQRTSSTTSLRALRSRVTENDIKSKGMCCCARAN